MRNRENVLRLIDLIRNDISYLRTIVEKRRPVEDYLKRISRVENNIEQLDHFISIENIDGREFKR